MTIVIDSKEAALLIVCNHYEFKFGCEKTKKDNNEPINVPLT